MQLPLGRRRRPDLAERTRVLTEVEGDAVRARADPHHLATRAQRVEVLGPVARHAPREQVALPERDRQSQRLERNERLAKRRTTVDPLPGGRKARERLSLDRLDLTAQRRERRAPQPPEHLRIAPLAFTPPGAQLAAHELIRLLEIRKDCCHVASEPLVRLGGSERAAPPCVPQHQLAERLGAALEVDVRQPCGRHRADTVAVAPCVFGGDQALLARDPHAHRPPLDDKHLRQRLVVFAKTQIAAEP